MVLQHAVGMVRFFRAVFRQDTGTRQEPIPEVRPPPFAMRPEINRGSQEEPVDLPWPPSVWINRGSLEDSLVASWPAVVAAQMTCVVQSTGFQYEYMDMWSMRRGRRCWRDMVQMRSTEPSYAQYNGLMAANFDGRFSVW